jgi:hypothetical protein
MTLALVLRLVEEALARGRLAGEVQIVETGERAVVRDAQELIEFVDRARGRLDRNPGGCGDDVDA